MDQAIYRKYENMINRFAWRYSRPGFCDFSEMKAQGNLIFVNSLARYDDRKASFSTYLYINLNFGLRRYLNRQLREEWPVLGEAS